MQGGYHFCKLLGTSYACRRKGRIVVALAGVFQQEGVLRGMVRHVVIVMKKERGSYFCWPRRGGGRGIVGFLRSTLLQLNLSAELLQSFRFH